jgi:hypothetical protein
VKTMAYAGAGLLAVALALYPLALVSDLSPLVWLAGLALLAFAFALLSREWILAGPGMGLLIGEYAIALHTGGVQVDELVPALAVAAFILMELIDLAGVLGRHPSPPREVVRLRAAHTVAAALMGGAVAIAVLLAARAVSGGPPQIVAVSAAAGLIALILAARLARRAIEGR